MARPRSAGNEFAGITKPTRAPFFAGGRDRRMSEMSRSPARSSPDEPDRPVPTALETELAVIEVHARAAVGDDSAGDVGEAAYGSAEANGRRRPGVRGGSLLY